jgi:hypothetical protein
MNLRYCFLIYISLFLISCGSSSDDNHPISRNSFSGTPLSSSLASNSTGAFKGSMAYASDSSMDSGEGVNPSTGSFTFKYDLLNVVGVGNMANTLSMSYNSSDVADAGKGWDFSMPYVNVNSNPRILNIDGAQYIIDPSKGEIGLKYITNRAVKFIQSQMAVSLSMECTNAPAERKYIFKYSDLIGQTNYFFASDGSLAAVSDNHKNCNIYKYTNGKLSEIVDSFGSKFIISNEYNVTKIQGASGDVIAR